MTQAEMQITMGYNRVLTHLREQYESYMSDARESPEDFEGIRETDVITWLVESFS